VNLLQGLHHTFAVDKFFMFSYGNLDQT